MGTNTQYSLPKQFNSSVTTILSCVIERVVDGMYLVWEFCSWVSAWQTNTVILQNNNLAYDHPIHVTKCWFPR